MGGGQRGRADAGDGGSDCERGGEGSAGAGVWGGDGGYGGSDGGAGRDGAGGEVSGDQGDQRRVDVRAGWAEEVGRRAGKLSDRSVCRVYRGAALDLGKGDGAGAR